MGKPDPGIRLQKLLAQAGLGSRRALEARIAAGEILVNGRPARLGDRVAAGDQVGAAGIRYAVAPANAPATRVIMLNKPEGVVCTRTDPDGRPTVFDHLPPLKDGRWITIGRLDLNTTGLLLLTNDGDLANTMMHPRGGVDREYACRIQGEVDDEMLARLKAGVELDDGPARFSDVVAAGGSGANRWYHATLMEGRKREVRRLWEAVGVRVSRLKRVRYGAVFLPSRLRLGRYEELSPADVKVLREDVGLPGVAPAGLKLKRLGGRRSRSRIPAR